METQIILKCCNCDATHRLSARDFENTAIQDSEIASKDKEEREAYETELKEYNMMRECIERYFEKYYKESTYRPTYSTQERRLLFFKKRVTHPKEPVKRFKLTSNNEYTSIYDNQEGRQVCQPLNGPWEPTPRNDYFILCPICETKIVVEFTRKCTTNTQK